MIQPGTENNLTGEKLIKYLFHDLLRWFKVTRIIPRNQNGKHEFPTFKMEVNHSPSTYYHGGSTELIIRVFGKGVNTVGTKPSHIRLLHNGGLGQSDITNKSVEVSWPRRTKTVSTEVVSIPIGDPQLIDKLKLEIDNWWDKVKSYYNF